MNNELNNVHHPSRLRFFWIAIYCLVIVSIVFVVVIVADQIKTHILPTGQVKLTVPYSKYLVGETVSYTLKNNYNSSVYIINNCPSEPLAVYRLEKDKWIRQHDQASKSECAGENRQVSIAAGDSISGNFAPWHHLFSQPGKYRLVAVVEHYNSLPYQEFEVVAANVSTVSTPIKQQSTAVSVPKSTTTSTTPPKIVPILVEQDSPDESDD